MGEIPRQESRLEKEKKCNAKELWAICNEAYDQLQIEQKKAEAAGKKLWEDENVIAVNQLHIEAAQKLKEHHASCQKCKEDEEGIKAVLKEFKKLKESE